MTGYTEWLPVVPYTEALICMTEVVCTSQSFLLPPTPPHQRKNKFRMVLQKIFRCQDELKSVTC